MRTREIEQTTKAYGTPDASTVSYDYDNNRNPLTTTQYVYNAGGEVVEEIDSLQRSTFYEYDAMGRQTVVSRPSPAIGQSRVETHFYYDAVGNLRLQKDANLNLTESRYDELNRVVATVAAEVGSAPTITSYRYDVLGQLCESDDALQNVTRYDYDRLGRLVAEIRPAIAEVEGGPLVSPTTVYHYDKNGNQTSVHEKISSSFTQVTTSQYDNLNRLTQRTVNANGSTGQQATTSFYYDAASRRIAVEDPLHRLTAYGYDALDRSVIESLSAPTFSPTVLSIRSYDPVGNVLSMTDAEGRTTTYGYDNLYRRVGSRLPAPGVHPGTGTQPHSAPQTFRTFDVAGRVQSETDALGRSTSYVYDNLDRTTNIILPEPAPGGSNPIWEFEYDAVGNLTAETDPESNRTVYRYDNQYRQTAVIAPPVDSGQLFEAIVDNSDAGQAFTTAGPDTWTTESGSGGLNDTFLHLPGGVGSNTATWAFSGLNSGRHYEVLVTWPEDSQNTNNAGFSVFDGDAAQGTLTGFIAIDQSAAPEGESVTGTIWQSLGLFYLSDDALTVVLSDDADGRVVADAVRVEEVGPVSQSIYDTAGRLESSQDYLGNTTSYEYDALGRTTRVVYPDPDGEGSGEASEMITRYNLSGNVTLEKNGLGETTFYGYDELQRRTSVTDANQDTTTFGYDLLGNLTSVTDPLSNTTSYEYDAFNRLHFERVTIDDQQLIREFRYDLVGNLTDAIDRNSRTIHYTYDNLDRQVAGQWIGGDTGGNVIYSVYDIGNRMTDVWDEFSRYHYDFDGLDRVQLASNAGTPDTPIVLLDPEYDQQNRRTSLAATIDGVADFITSYGYNPRSQLTTVEQQSQPGGQAVTYKRVELAYDANDRLDEILRYASPGTSQLVASTSFRYDPASRLTGIVHGGVVAGSPDPVRLAEYTWSHDQANRVDQFTFSAIVDAVGTMTGGTSTYDYDARGQLEAATHDYQSNEDYNYDENGNRISYSSTSTGGGQEGVTTDDHNRLESDGTFTYVYDNEGNRTLRTRISTDPSDDYITEYEWDHRNRLIKVTHKNNSSQVTSRVEYTYDALNRRIGKVLWTLDSGSGLLTLDSRQVFVYDPQDTGSGHHVTLRFVDPDGDGAAALQLANRYLHGNVVDQVFSDENLLDGETYWMLTDNLGSVRQLVAYDAATDTTTVEDYLEYDSFGNITRDENTAVDTIFAYTGREFDAETGNYHYRARPYDPVTGRFLSEDPIQDDFTNLHRYVENDPLNRVDPTGLGDVVGAVWSEQKRKFEIYYLERNYAEGELSKVFFKASVQRMQSGAKDHELVLVGELDNQTGDVRLTNGRWTTMSDVRKHSDGWTDWDEFKVGDRTNANRLSTLNSMGSQRSLAKGVMIRDAQRRRALPNRLTKDLPTIDEVSDLTQAGGELVEQLMWFYATAGIDLAAAVKVTKSLSQAHVIMTPLSDLRGGAFIDGMADISKLRRGRRDGVILNDEWRNALRSELKSMDDKLRLRIDDDTLAQKGLLGGFQPQSRTVVLRSDATLFEAVHEVGHARFFAKTGSKADDYLNFSAAGRELEAWRYVLDYAKKFPGRFSADEMAKARSMYNEEFYKLFGHLPE